MGIRLGTSGWSYSDWQGPVYPKGVKPADRLSFYARSFPTVEVNTTFYGDPSPKTVAGWIERTAFLPHFELSVKAPKALTQTALASSAPSVCARLAREWAELVLRPLQDAHRLGAVFLQLSPGVVHYDEPMARLAATLDALEGHPPAVEFRNRSWLMEDGRLRDDALALLDERDAALVIVDGPSWPPLVEGSATHAYVRFHGRNEDVWQKGGKNKPENDPDDPRMNRYDYFYDEAELRPWAERLGDLVRKKSVVRAYFNNHPGGQAWHDALLLEGMLRDLRAAVDRTASPQRRL